jgi:hypothetical protein
MITIQDYQNLRPAYIDTNGFIKPKSDSVDSGNGILYSALELSLLKANKLELTFAETDYFPIVARSMKEPGLLSRSPTKTEQEQWDDYLGLTLASAVTNNTVLLRQSLVYGFKHLFVMNNDNKLEAMDWLGRYPHLWMLMTATAFPTFKWIFFAPLAIVATLLTPNLNDQSGCNLQYAFQSTIRSLYRMDFLFERWNRKLKLIYPNGYSENLRAYTEPGHALEVLSIGGY